MTYREQIRPDRLPQHIAVIMDGNGRWARKRGLHRYEGHQEGVKAVRKLTENATELGIKYLTIYAFSTENWFRPKAEVDALMDLLADTVVKQTPDLLKNNVRLHTIGDLDSLPEKAREKMQQSIKETSVSTGLNLIVALSYSSKQEITRAVQNIARELKDGKISEQDITADTISQHLYTSEFPDPDLLIRTSGELRISNFLLWQLAYTELYFTPCLWPDFDMEELCRAIVDYQNRERRFGKTSEQIKQ